MKTTLRTGIGCTVIVFAAVMLAMLLAGCNALGGISPEAVKAMADAGGGCIDVESQVLGKGSMIFGNADKGTLRNGEVTVTCPGGRTLVIKDSTNARPVPGTVTTITVPATTTTTVAPAPKP